ncbi:MAG: hypothetical protein Q9226_009070 [Calogaya cf. arnoldii]
MAINTYLSVFKKYNAQQLKAMEWRYHLLCYGTPFIIALIFCFVDSQGRGRMICIAVSLTLYVLSGLKIARNREEIRALRQPSHASADENFPPYKTTRIDVTSELAGFPVPQAPANCFDPKNRHRHLTVSSKDYEPYSTMISSSTPTNDSDPSPRQSSFENPASRGFKAALEDNKNAIKYTKVALLFFASLCITWVPSSINRVYDLSHPDDLSYALNFISAIVLPLMGFWNGVIYFATSRAVCAGILRDQLERWAPRKRIPRISGESHSLRTSRAGAGSSMTEGLVPTKKEVDCHDLAGLPKDEERF